MARTYANALVTEQQVGKIRDISEVIDDLDREDTPFCTTIGTGRKAKSGFTEWEVDSLPVYDADRAAEQGKKAEPSAVDQPEFLGNHTHIIEDTASVTTSAEKTAQYNIKRKLARDMMRKSKGLKLMIEARAMGNYGSQEANAASTNTGKFAGALSWLTGPNVSRGATGADGGYSAATKLVTPYTAGTDRALTQDMFVDTVRVISQDRPKTNYDVFVGAQLRQKISRTFNGIAQLTQEVTKGDSGVGLVGSVGFIRTDWGVARIHYAHKADPKTVLIIDKSRWSKRPFDPWKTQDLGRTGLSKEKQIWTELTLECTNPDGSGAIVDIDPAL